MERKRNSVNLLGLNSSEDDHSVSDGHCEMLHNIRYRNGSWETLGTHLNAKLVNITNGWTIQHKLSNNEYIATQQEQSSIRIASVRVTNSEIQTTTTFKELTIPMTKITDISFYSLGNILFINTPDHELSFILADGIYTDTLLSDLSPLNPEIELTYSEIEPSNGWLEYKNTEKINWWQHDATAEGGYEKIDDNYQLALTIERNGTSIKGFTESPPTYQHNIPKHKTEVENDYIVGNVSLFVAYELFDGTVIKPSRPIKLSSLNKQRGYIYRSIELIPSSSTPTNQVQADNSPIKYFTDYFSFKPTISINIPEISTSPILNKIVIYSTRPLPLLDYESIHNHQDKFFTELLRGELPGQKPSQQTNPRFKISRCPIESFNNKDNYDDSNTFYRIAEIDCSTSGKKSIELKYSQHYKNIEHQPIYLPNFEIHNRISNKKYTYNDRLHTWNTQFKLYNGYNSCAGPEFKGIKYHKILSNRPSPPNEEPLSILNGYNVITQTHIKIGSNHTKIITNALPLHIWNTDTSNPLALIYTNQIYPDSRAYKMDVYIAKTSLLNSNFISAEIKFSKELTLKPNHSNNTASCYLSSNPTKIVEEVIINPNTNSSIELFSLRSTTYSDKDTMRVSRQNNPFVFDPINTYIIEPNNKIRAICTTAEQLSEGRYGQHPLVLFTDLGIWSMEQSASGDTLYSNCIPISHEVLNNNSNPISANGLIYFMDNRGLNIINGRQIKFISQSIEHTLINSTQSNTYYENTIIKYNPIYFELLIFTPGTSDIIVYNTAHRVFSTASIDWSKMITNSNELLSINNNIIELGHEQWSHESNINFRIKTRPLKLNSIEAKRLEYVSLRLNNSEDNTKYTVRIYGSNDLLHWSNAHLGNNTTLLRRFTASYMYFILEIIGSGYLRINRIDFQYYERFRKKIR